ncbi:MAG TPA: branched-chain amino acid aminotransferase [Spirochaetota bacterium]|nr:branched-chain amino acid aminotransferase [Spirochaetota bacterium]HPC41223.1 branched-chain amino acid aminotransferase [Spirochaetota bacterium]HQF08165.1 branched-chain amino acid aminotransferase [Spirochaetota bacterium]HQH96948.1 branched-chain amino acid aminotransferase [Spirochaetota bacterium]HQJ70130.1 branched-chain amino acid aminotransferase [Spirochaetota bacterium]
MNMQDKTRAQLDWKNLPFGYEKTDYNVRYYYKDGTWSAGELVSDEIIPLHMAAPCLHYGQEAFEGLKAFETKDGRAVVFRPIENAHRLQKSCRRIFIPEIPDDMFMDAVQKVVAANRRFLPPYGTGASMYLRPLAIGIGARVGLGPASEYIFIMFATPVGPYYKGGFKPVKALVVEQFDRAAPQGVGDCKVGGNYAAGLAGGEYGHDHGYPVVLYLDSKEHRYIDEFSTSNFIGIKDNTYVTPKSGSILPSITNDSLSIIAQDMGMIVERRPVEASELESFDEVGAVGTAAVITPVNLIRFRDRNYTFGNGDEPGPVVKKLYDRLTKIQTGDYEDKFGWLYEVK